MSKQAFTTAFNFTMKWEVGPFFDPTDPDVIAGAPGRKTGYVNHPNDPGGVTKFGIASRYNKGVDIERLTLEQAMEIYYNKYWMKNKCNILSAIYLPLGIAHFDWCVTSNARTVNRKLQKLVGARPDGLIGKKTIRKVQEASPDFDFVTHYLDVRREYYRALARKRPKLQVFLKGWLNRVNDLQHVLEELDNG